MPGLALAAEYAPDRRYLFVEASQKRSAFLKEAVEALGLSARVQVLASRAEILGRAANFRATVDVVVARGFGPPAVTAECAAPFLKVGGVLICSEPPSEAVGERRWKGDVSLVGLGPPRGAQSGGFNFELLEQVALCSDRFPRRDGIPRKRPLFT